MPVIVHQPSCTSHGVAIAHHLFSVRSIVHLHSKFTSHIVPRSPHVSQYNNQTSPLPGNYLVTFGNKTALDSFKFNEFVGQVSRAGQALDAEYSICTMCYVPITLHDVLCTNNATRCVMHQQRYTMLCTNNATRCVVHQ